MVDTMERVFDVPVQHCAIGSQTNFVGRAMDVEPGMRVRFVLAQLIPHLGMEYLGSSTRHAAKSRVSKILQDPTDRLLRLKLKPIDFDGRPPLQMNLRVILIQELNDVAIPLVGLLMMQTAHDVHLRASVISRLLTAGKNLLVTHHIPFRVAKVATKRTKAATVDADVGRIQMCIDIEVGDVPIRPGYRGSAKVHVDPMSLGGRLWRVIAKTFNFEL